MCRLVAYFGRHRIPMSSVLDEPTNSLIKQSRTAREGKTGLNADGFGVSWYGAGHDDYPGMFKSIQPAWNDSNLKSLASSVSSHCFLGHVRASTVGDVNMYNCHPFAFNKFSFVHNGTIREFSAIRRALLASLSDESYDLVKGRTDSEAFFALMADIHQKNFQQPTLETLSEAFREALMVLKALQAKQKMNPIMRLNTVFTDGQKMVATRYISDINEIPLSLHYALGDVNQDPDSPILMDQTDDTPSAILIASEVLTDFADNWVEVPINHILQVSADLHVNIEKI